LTGILLLFTLSCNGSHPTSAEAQEGTPPQLVITEIRPGWVEDALLVEISGYNFENGQQNDPTVILGETPLTVLEFDDYLILAEGQGFSAGDYLLTVSTGPAAKDCVNYNLTIGAMG